jgi:membrane peptidoglycan carboxypeptidase
MKYKWLSVYLDQKSGALLRGGLALAFAAVAIYALAAEVQSSTLQAALFGKLARESQFKVEPGPSDAISFPGPGPYDTRLGYTQMPRWVERLAPQGYAVTAQARMSPRLLSMSERGLFPPYREKDQAGLELRDCRREPLMVSRYPQRTYERFESVPPLLVSTLLFIENRELLATDNPSRNPAVEWDRFGKAAMEWARHVVDDDRNAAGGSTLATQIEKYRHSPEGRTESVGEKLRQMASASMRAYAEGNNTLPRRQAIALSYLNTVPLAAKNGFGEVNGLGDGMWAWYGRDFADFNQLLSTFNGDTGPTPLTAPRRQPLAFKGALVLRQATAFKQALSLMVAQRRPSYYLGEGETALGLLTNSYLRLMADAGVISPALRDAALPVKLKLQERAPPQPRLSFVERKAATAVRNRLSELLGVPRSYDLDRIDLVAHSGTDGDAQRAATRLLHNLKDPEAAQAAGLYGDHLLRPGDDPARLTLSFTLFERGERANILRVQADNHDQPFDLNDGAWLDLGSTAKLRTLITYLEIVATLHQRWSALPASELEALAAEKRDPLGRWVLEYLGEAAPDERGLEAILEAATLRIYSTSAAESFFTGGGVHHFVNFEAEKTPPRMTVREAFKHSVNLVFVRMMKDVVRYYMFDASGSGSVTLDDPADPRRKRYLDRYVEREGRDFIVRFYRKHQGAQRLPGSDGADPRRAHPLELWVMDQLRERPGATLDDVLAASRSERQKAYEWLYKTRNKNAQDVRIQIQRELEAFVEIHRAWRKLGYPFESLTPSYATSIGASGDRPAALAELVGIIVSRGMRLPSTRITALEFARRTPYETRLDYQPPAAQRVLPTEVADVVRRSLIDVVQDGTAKRLRRAWLQRDGSVVTFGGKTGTGDHRFDVFGRGGRLISSRIVNRTATFAFLIDDRYFGTIMAYVHEPYAAKYKFTSALPVQLLKTLTPTLLPLLEHSACRDESSTGAPDLLSARSRTEAGAMALAPVRYSMPQRRSTP